MSFGNPLNSPKILDKPCRFGKMPLKIRDLACYLKAIILGFKCSSCNDYAYAMTTHLRHLSFRTILHRISSMRTVCKICGTLNKLFMKSTRVFG
jgi:hypothetical protein